MNRVVVATCCVFLGLLLIAEYAPTIIVIRDDIHLMMQCVPWMAIYAIAVYQHPFEYIYLAMVVGRSYIVYRVCYMSTTASFIMWLMVYAFQFGIRNFMYETWTVSGIYVIVALFYAVIFPRGSLCFAITLNTVHLLDLRRYRMVARCRILQLFRDLRRQYASNFDTLVRLQTWTVRTLVQPASGHTIRSHRPHIVQSAFEVLKVHGLATLVCDYGHGFPLVTTVARGRDARRETRTLLEMEAMFLEMDIVLTEWLGSNGTFAISALVPILVRDCGHSLNSRVMDIVMHQAWIDETERVLNANSIVICICEYGIYIIMRPAGSSKPIIIRTISRGEVRFPMHLIGVHELSSVVAPPRFKDGNMGGWTLSCSGMPAVIVDVVHVDEAGVTSLARKFDPIQYMALYVAK